MNKLGIIGAGNIGLSMARGLVKVGGWKPSEILLSRRKSNLLLPLKGEGFQVTGDNRELVRQSSVIILAVLPGQAEAVCRELADQLDPQRHLLISVISAASLNELKRWLGTEVQIVRAMPNTAAEYGASMICLAGENPDAVGKAEKLLRPLGSTMVISEQLIPAATILAACGIAYFLRVIRAASQGGIQIGFHAEEAGRIAAQTAKGAAEILLRTGNHPEEEIDKVTTPMGCTISGLNEMEHFGLSSAMIKGIIKSYAGFEELK
ncbi:MAG: pyrroline-5-carboxylate reductase [Bacteroidota bacterium]